MNPIQYFLNEGFRKTSDPNTYASGKWGLRNYTVNGYNYDSYCGGMHPAYDFSKADGAAIPTFSDGIVVAGTSVRSNFGAQVVIAYAQFGIQVIYGHLKRNLPVKIGDVVRQGQTIGYQGNTNYENVRMDSHLHIQFQPLGYIPDEWTFVCTGIDVLDININKTAPEPAGKDEAMIIDVSHHQPSKSIDYATLSQHVDHVIIRTMDADMIDRAYKTHHENFRKHGVPTAAYAFFRARNDTHVVNEAEMFWNRTKDLDPTFWWIDVETSPHPNMRKAVNDYIVALRNHGAKKVGLYIAHHLYEQLNLDTSKADAVWIPHYGTGSAKADSSPSFPADIHQYTEHGRLPGYNSNLDLNRIISDKSLEYFTEGKASKNKLSVPATDKSGGQSESKSTSTYTINSGDTLSGIAQKFGTTVSAIQSENNILNSNRINAGDTIRIPGRGPSTNYTAQSGDTLSHIAQRHGVTVSALQNANNIGNKDVIYAGQTLTIPGKVKKKAAPKNHYHKVQSGDTVSALANKYGTSQSQIIKWNKLASADRIYVGQNLRVK